MNTKPVILTVFGTRPEAVKMAPLVKELASSGTFNSKVCVTGQHREMLDQVLKIFNIVPDIDLDIMKSRQTLTGVTTRILEGMETVFQSEKPDMVLVHGDTSTTFSTALAAFYAKIPVGHVEAGLRTYDKYFPYPEELNRKMTGSLSDIHFAPTEKNYNNLLAEGVKPESIYITGNTVIDAMGTTVRESYTFFEPTLRKVNFEKSRIIAVTAHRRENLGEPLENICNALKNIAYRNADIEIVYPVHLNPAVQNTANEILGNVPNVHLIAPLQVEDMHNLMARSYLVLTDSGGLQEEAPSLGKPVLVMRNETERPEAVSAGTVKLVGTNRETIENVTQILLDQKEEYNVMARSINPYGDGKASKRIVEALKFWFNFSKIPPEPFNIGVTR